MLYILMKDAVLASWSAWSFQLAQFSLVMTKESPTICKSHAQFDSFKGRFRPLTGNKYQRFLLAQNENKSVCFQFFACSQL